MKNRTLFFVVVVLGIFSCKTLKPIQENEDRITTEINSIFLNMDNDTTYIDNFDFRNLIELSNDFELVDVTDEKDRQLDDFGMRHVTYQFKYKNLLVYGSQLKFHIIDDGRIKYINGQYFENLKLETIPTISNEDAFKLCIENNESGKYTWQVKNKEWFFTNGFDHMTTPPKGELIIYPKPIDNDEFKIYLAYKFEVNSLSPAYENYTYVNALNGKIIDIVDRRIFCNGTGESIYSGNVPVCSSSNGSDFILVDNNRGNGVITKNQNNTTSPIYYSSQVTDFTDNDDIWTRAEHDNPQKDIAAIDAHFGAIKFYDYLLAVHNRSSIDDLNHELKQYVHSGVNCNNALWSGAYKHVEYGDGDGITWNPLTKPDIVAHEFSHGLLNFEGLIYTSFETGALHEGISDILGACLDNYGNIGNPWLIGENVNIISIATRSMENPILLGNPACIGDPYYYSAGTHGKGNVISHWFYILSQGKTGINCLGNNYAVKGIGIKSAERILYRVINHYLMPYTDFTDFTNFTIAACKDIYGNCSNELNSLNEAWYAVGMVSQNRTNLTITNTINTSSYILRKADFIDARNVISSASNVEYRAKKEIILQPGFQSKLNSKFVGRICPE